MPGLLPLGAFENQFFNFGAQIERKKYTNLAELSYSFDFGHVIRHLSYLEFWF